MEQTNNIQTWLQEEQELLKTTTDNENKTPTLKLEENKIVEITVDFTAVPFKEYEDAEKGIIKKLIPVTVKGQPYVWWLNTRNPVYAKLIKGGLQGQTTFNILQIGNKNNTRYEVVEK